MAQPSAAAPPLYYSEAGEAELGQLYDAALAALPEPHSERYVHTPSFGRVHVLECGPPGAPALVLWHGTACPGPVMLSSFAKLAGQYRVIVPDIPCEAGSRSDPAVLEPAAHGHGRWAAEVLQALGLIPPGPAPSSVRDVPTTTGGGSAAATSPAPSASAGASGISSPLAGRPPLHMGVSMGGAMLLDLAVLRPEAVGALVLVVPGSFNPDAAHNQMPWKAALAFVLHTLLRRDWTGALLARVMMAQMCEEPGSADVATQTLRLAFRHCQYFPELPRPETITDDALRKLTAPVLLVAAEHDVFGPGRGSVERAKRVWRSAQCETMLLQGCKHVSGAARAAELADRILQFLGSRGLADAPTVAA